MTADEFCRRAISVPYVLGGRDWTGWDCWGLVYVAFDEVFGTPLASFADRYDSASFAEFNALIDAQRIEWNDVTVPRLGDVSLFRVGRSQSHIAFVLEHGQMIHCTSRMGTVRDRLDSLVWAKRHAGYFRHESRFSRRGDASA